LALENKIITLAIALTIALIIGACVAPQNNPPRAQVGDGAHPATSMASDVVARIPLATGEALIVRRDVIEIAAPTGRIAASNPRLVRERDPQGRCPAEGFVDAEANSTGFSIHNQLCGGWFFIDETLTFTPAASGDGYILLRLTVRRTDRREPERGPQEETLTAKKFGEISFETLDPDALYALFE
jgi:hypothetical protein